MGKKKKHKTTFKKPPDKYNCIKVPFSKIIIDETKKNKIFDCIVRTNEKFYFNPKFGGKTKIKRKI